MFLGVHLGTSNRLCVGGAGKDGAGKDGARPRLRPLWPPEPTPHWRSMAPLGEVGHRPVREPAGAGECSMWGRGASGDGGPCTDSKDTLGTVGSARRSSPGPPGWSAGGGAWDAQWHQSLPQPPGTCSLDAACASLCPAWEAAGAPEPSPKTHTLNLALRALWLSQCGPELGRGPGGAGGSQREPQL